MTNITRKYTNTLQKRIEEPYPLIQVLIGPRQVGKTTSLKQIESLWKGPSIYISADGVTPPDNKWIELYWNKARQNTEPTLLIIDEIQKVSGWSETIKILFDQDRDKNDLRIILSGSASLSLQQGLTESLAGRYELIRALHWSYAEHIEAHKWTFEQYLKFGGYPSAAKFIDEIPRWKSFIQNSIIEPVIGKDILSSVQIKNPSLLRQVFELAMSLPCHEISYQKILRQLQDKGNAATIKHYLQILEGAFLLKSLPKYAKRTVKVKSSSPKILPSCSALIHAYIDPGKINTDNEWHGHVFETIVGNHLSTLNTPLYYWREGKYEVDFVFELEQNLYAVEIKSNKKKSSKGLYEFLSSYPEAKTILINRDNLLNFLSKKDPSEWQTLI